MNIERNTRKRTPKLNPEIKPETTKKRRGNDNQGSQSLQTKCPTISTSEFPQMPPSQINNSPILQKTKKYSIIDRRPISATCHRTGKYAKAFEALQESYQVPSLFFRDNEKNRIKKYISDSIASNGTDIALYITGLPGLGKTACVNEVIFQMANSSDLFHTYINALKMNSPTKFYAFLWKSLTGLETTTKDACKNLSEYFYKEKYKNDELPKNAKEIRKKIKILVIDEIDFLLSKKQEILYNLFDWMHSKHSKLIIICISNTLDLVDKLIAKIKSRMGHNILTFKPYTGTEINGIMRQRLKIESPEDEKRSVFSKDALLYISRKIANFTSDIRKCLDISRRCLQSYLTDAHQETQITIERVNEVFKLESNKPMLVFLETSPIMLQIFIISLLVEKVVTQRSQFDVEQIFSRINSILKQSLYGELDYGQFKMLLLRAQEMSLIKVTHSNNERPKIDFCADSEELAFGLRDNRVFQRFGPMVESMKDL